MKKKIKKRKKSSKSATKSQLLAAENRGYIRGFNAARNNPE
jgi:hypothetical protein